MVALVKVGQTALTGWQEHQAVQVYQELQVQMVLQVLMVLQECQEQVIFQEQAALVVHRVLQE